VAGGIVESYRRLSTGLLTGLRVLGADVFQAQTEKVINPQQGAACFDTPSNYEITVSGKKLVGSAQVRRRGIVLQHGTLPLFGDLSRIFDCLRDNAPPSPSTDLPLAGDRPSDEDRRRRTDLLARACTLEWTLGRAVSFDEAAHALTQGFASALNLELKPGHVTQDELTLVERLRREQYASDDWNRRI
jgi:lipoate-protein ligase A